MTSPAPTARLGQIACLLFKLLLAGCLACQAQADRPNVLFISADDMRFEPGAYGAPHVQTPHLDRLANEWDSRSPLILRGPGVPAGVETNALVEFVDIYPTVAALAGFPLPDGLDGANLQPVLRQPRHPGKAAVSRKSCAFSRMAASWRSQCARRGTDSRGGVTNRIEPSCGPSNFTTGSRIRRRCGISPTTPPMRRKSKSCSTNCRRAGGDLPPLN